MIPMRRAVPLLLLLLLAACQGTKEESDSAVPQLGQDPVEGMDNAEPAVIAQRIERNVKAWRELQIQGQTQQMAAMRLTISRSVDENFDALRELALRGELQLHRNPAVRCLGFANERRTDAREALLQLCADPHPWIAANAAFGLGTLRDKETDLTPIIALCGSGDARVRENAAVALRDLFLVRETPRTLTPQLIAAVDRLVTMLQDKSSVRGRRASAWALANLRHPDVLDHLASALKDRDEQVQIGGLRGLQLLGDQRGLEPVLQYLGDAPTSEGASWAQRTLIDIVTQAGFVKDAKELQELGTSERLWRAWIEHARMR